MLVLTELKSLARIVSVKAESVSKFEVRMEILCCISATFIADAMPTLETKIKLPYGNVSCRPGLASQRSPPQTDAQKYGEDE